MSILRLLYQSNPFYFLSALFVLVGLKRLLPTGDSAAYEWALMGLLGGYISILAAAAFLIIRFGKVWDDARSVLLTIFLLLVALSVSFDEKVVSSPLLGCALLGAGGVFACLVTEALLRGLRIRLPLGIRIPLHLLLLEFFLAPLLLTWTLHGASSGAIDWAVFGFSPCFGLSLLTLLPAVRGGRSYTRENGTPWPWPLFPWTPFALLAFAACARSYYFCYSFGAGQGAASPFAVYFLAPIVLAAVIIVLEAAIVERKPWAQRVALAIPFAFTLLVLNPMLITPAAERFLRSFIETAASPAYLTLIATAALGAYAMARRASGGEAALLLSLVLLSAVGPRDSSWADLGPARPLPLYLASGVQLLLVFRNPGSARLFLFASGLLAAVFLSLPPAAGWSRWIVAANVLVGQALVFGAVFKDRFAGFLQTTGALGTLLLSFAALFLKDLLVPTAEAWSVALYLSAMLGVQVAYWHAARNPLYLYSALLSAAACLGAFGWSLVPYLRRLFAMRGFLQLVGGAALFVLALLISLSKASTLRGTRRRLGGVSGAIAPPNDTAAR